ncbi:MAG: prolyl oligopeptidase family serine peptidase [Polyangiaceae bacterium]
MGTRRDDVVDVLFGHKVEDPYRWLEDGKSEEVAKWTERQNARTKQVLGAYEGRQKIHDRLRELLAIGVVTAPTVKRVDAKTLRYFWVSREGDQNQMVVQYRDNDGAAHMLLDPNPMSSDGTVSLDWWFPSWDGKLVAYGLSQSGSEESTLHIRDVATGKDLPDQITRTRYASVAWLPDGKGFYYARYPAKGSVAEGDEKYYRKIFFHKLGADPDKDELVWGEGREKTDSPGVLISPNGRWLAIRVHQSWSRSEVYLIDRSKAGSKPITVAAGTEALYDPILRDDLLYIHTNDGAPKFKLVAVAPEKAGDRSAWKTLIPEGQHALQDVSVLGKDLYAIWLRDAVSHVTRHGLDGVQHEEIKLPTMGAVDSVRGPIDGGEVFLDFTSFAVPPTVMRRDPKTGSLSTWASVKGPFDPSLFEVAQFKATSSDKTEVPYFVLSKKGAPKDGTAPVLIHAYGGFNISLRPELRRASLMFAERGGVVVVANLRGGGEYGEEWHKQGMREHKQNVFNDLYAVAGDISERKIGAKDRLAFWGGSNGGLLASVAVTQRPELWKAVISAVPLTDMVRFPKFLIAQLWVGEYGNPEKESELAWLLGYSPYHHVKSGTKYPATLFTTAESDSRVDPLHARKMAALLQESTGSEAPILLRVETKAGHGAGKPVHKQVEELTDAYSFLFQQL